MLARVPKIKKLDLGWAWRVNVDPDEIFWEGTRKYVSLMNDDGIMARDYVQLIRKELANVTSEVKKLVRRLTGISGYERSQ